MNTCLSCGALVDGDVCGPVCEDALRHEVERYDAEQDGAN